MGVFEKLCKIIFLWTSTPFTNREFQAVLLSDFCCRIKNIFCLSYSVKKLQFWEGVFDNNKKLFFMPSYDVKYLVICTPSYNVKIAALWGVSFG